MSVIISYSSQDKEFARRLADDLKNRGIEVWFDEYQIAPGDSIIGAIEAGLDQMAFLIVVLTPTAVASGWVKKELRTALHQPISGGRDAVIPILRETCEIPPLLLDLKHIDMGAGYDYPAGLEKLVRRVTGSQGGHGAFPITPHPGLPGGPERRRSRVQAAGPGAVRGGCFLITLSLPVRQSKRPMTQKTPGPCARRAAAAAHQMGGDQNHGRRRQPEPLLGHGR
ncbi:MAG: toll/interleukin-1 receptor domain-containing protein [Desulfobacterales bacterium]